MKKLMIATAATLLLTGGTANATTFNFTFNDINGIGNGTLSVEKNLAAGNYKLSDVGTYSFDFRPAGQIPYTNANIKTTVSTVLLVVTGEVGALSMTFSNTQPYGDGPREGSLDLIGDTKFMSFVAPGGAGSFPFPTYFTGTIGTRPFFARYSAVEASVSPVPEASTWLMMMAGFTMLGVSARYRRRRPTFRYA